MMTYVTAAEAAERQRKTVGQLATSSGMTPSALSHYLHGRSGLSMDAARRLAQTAGVSLETVVSWRGSLK